MRIVMRKDLEGGQGDERCDETGGIRTVENFILTHAVWVPVTAEADYNEAVLF